MVLVEPAEVITIYDYLTTLTASERDELAFEVGYASSYFNLLVSTRKNLSEFLATAIQGSVFNQTNSERGARVTKKMLDAHTKELTAIRFAAGKKRRVKKSKQA